MNRILKTTILTAAVAATTIAAMPLANAGEHWRHGGRRHHVERGINGGEMLAAGIVGLALGAIVAGASNPPAPGYYEPNPYRAPRPSPDRSYFPETPAPVHYGQTYAGGIEPWTSEWYQYCVDRYRSFDPQTGTYTTYGGEQRFCVAN